VITTDDNPGIQNYIGRGEVIAAQRYGNHVVSLQARHSLRGGEDSRGHEDQHDFARPPREEPRSAAAQTKGGLRQRLAPIAAHPLS
jgi:hypothetical protein